MEEQYLVVLCSLLCKASAMDLRVYKELLASDRGGVINLSPHEVLLGRNASSYQPAAAGQHKRDIGMGAEVIKTSALDSCTCCILCL